MKEKRTHRLVKTPKIAGRFLAEYMNASEQRRRSIVRSCKYRAIARVIQHDHARSAIGRFCHDPLFDVNDLKDREEQLRTALASDPFERDLLDHNADYIAKFSKNFSKISAPYGGSISPPGECPSIMLEGVKVTPEIAFRVSRVTKTNKFRIGAGTLRYSKGKALKEDEAIWQAAFLHGYLARGNMEESAEAEGKLCLVVDAFSGKIHSAPSDAVSRFNNMEAACASIAERWDNIPPPNGASI